MASVQGAWDLHLHAAPSLFERRADARETAETCHRAGMAGIVLKAHHGSTVEAAAALDRRFGELRVLGGVVLNLFSGGLNPYAVDAALRLGAAIVWLPTIHAEEHGRRLGQLGGFGFQSSRATLTPPAGLTLLDGSGGLAEPVKEILGLMDGSPAVLATGHVSAAEIAALQAHIRREGRRIRLLVNHVFFKAPDLTDAQLREFANERTWFEITFSTVSPQVRYRTVEEIAGRIGAFPAARWVMTSDAGQKHNPPAPEALSAYADGLARHGVPVGEIDRMMRERPRELLADRL